MMPASDGASESHEQRRALMAAFESAIAHAGAAPDLRDRDMLFEPVEKATFAALRSGNGDIAIAPLEHLCSILPKSHRAWWLLGVVLRDEQAHERALKAMERAVALAPDDARALLGVAQLRYETGRHAVDAFRAAQSRLSDNGDVLRNLAGALAADGRVDEAQQLLADAVAARPGWIEGQQYLATLRRTSGEADNFDRGFADACRAEPRNPGLRLGWFHLLSKAKDWNRARAVVMDGRRALGPHPALDVALLYIASESGEGSDDPDLFAGIPDRADPGLDLCRVRHALRGKRPDEAARIAERHLATPSTPLFWPYLSLSWRMLDDDRAMWLDRPDRFIKSLPLGLGRAELRELAELLRSLHIMSAPYLEQSVRGGTQTDRPLLFRHEPVIRRTREAILEAARTYAAALPPAETAHPLLSVPRTDMRFAGSWSVRLSAQGFHAAHTHPAGWLSSALYVSLPDSGAMGPPPSGWLRFGTPPPELGLDLQPYCAVEPEVGRLVLFPSTMWHCTAPFSDGERLTVAFDIQPPRR